MDADERLNALKKAYAEIILNTAKEAAARVLSSERKALRFQQELFSAKEDALQMMLRLKQMIDFKTSEAEVTSNSQQKKIEELEAQLHEAEDIVNELRVELRELQDQLERLASLKTKQLETSDEKRNDSSQPLGTALPKSESRYSPASEMNYSNSNHLKESHAFKDYAGNSDCPSKILISKKPELYRNGCTQRIRACEMNLLAEELSFSEKVNDAKHESSIKENVEVRICKPLVVEANRVCNLEKKVPKVIKVGNSCQAWLKSLRKKGNKAAIYRKNRIPFCFHQANEVKKPKQLYQITCSDILTSVEGNSSEKESTKANMLVSSDINDLGTNKEYAKTTKSDGTLIGVQSTDILASLRRENGECREVLEAQACQIGPEGINVPSVAFESNANATWEGISAQPVNDRAVITFQRKRKRGILSSSDVNTSSSRKKNAGENENGYLEAEKSCLMSKSSQDTRRLKQVTCQLISLSENKWWL